MKHLLTLSFLLLSTYSFASSNVLEIASGDLSSVEINLSKSFSARTCSMEVLLLNQNETKKSVSFSSELSQGRPTLKVPLLDVRKEVGDYLLVEVHCYNFSDDVDRDIKVEIKALNDFEDQTAVIKATMSGNEKSDVLRKAFHINK